MAEAVVGSSSIPAPPTSVVLSPQIVRDHRPEPARWRIEVMDTERPDVRDRERPNLEGYEADAKSAALAYDLSCRELAQAIYTDRKLVEKLDEAWQRIVHKGNVTDTTTLAELRQLEAEAELGTPTLRTFGVSFAMWQGATPNEVKRLRKLFRNPEEQANFPTLARLRAAIRAVDVQNSQPSPEERLATQRDRASAIAAAAIGAQGRTLAPEDRIEIGDTINKANKAAETEAELASVTK